MSTEENKALVRRAIEDLNQGNFGEADEYFTPNFVYHDAANPHVHSREEYKQFLTNMQASLSGQFTIEDLIAEGDQVAVRLTLRGTHTSDLVTVMHIPATGKQVTESIIAVIRFASGKAVEAWNQADTLGFLQQLSLIPAPG